MPCTERRINSNKCFNATVTDKLAQRFQCCIIRGECRSVSPTHVPITALGGNAVSSVVCLRPIAVMQLVMRQIGNKLLRGRTIAFFLLYCFRSVLFVVASR